MKVLLVICAISITIWASLSWLRIKAENTHDVELAIEHATTTRQTVEQLASRCSTTTAARIPAGVFGVSTVPPFPPVYYERLSDLGIQWTRSEFDWNAIEQPDGRYDWNASDALVRDSHAHNISLLGNINYLPIHLRTWAEAQGHFETFVRALVERYKPGGTFAQQEGWRAYGVSYWEIFNEPNLTGWGWMSKGSSAEEYVGEYAALLAVANAAIRRSDKDAVIVLGGVSDDDVAGMPYPKFFDALFSYGVSSCFDVIAFHPYGRYGTFAATADEIRAIAKRSGIEKPLWFNEYGTDNDRELDTALTALFNEREAADAWFWFTLRDLRPNRRWSYGLTDYEFNPKPAYERLKDLLRDRPH